MSMTAEIARLLRTTDDNAARFMERVRAEVSDPISDEDLAEIIRGINPRQLSLPKVIHAVRDYHKRLAAREAKRAARRSAKRPAVTEAAAEPEVATTEEPVEEEASQPRARREVALVRPRSNSSLVARIGEVLERNWARAEREGYTPERLDAEAFINAVRDYTDPRDATHARILEALKELDRQDVLITPTVAADRVRELAY
jgi:hypothetical protein